MSDFGWIPVKERLPEDTLAKLVTIKIDFPAVCKGITTDVAYYLGKKWYLVGSGVELRGLKVIAWMPFPEPYKEESEDDHTD